MAMSPSGVEKSMITSTGPLELRCNADADRSDAGDFARVASLLGGVLRFECGGDGEFRIGLREGHDPLAHAAGRPVHA